MDNRAVHGVHTGQQSSILQFVFSPKEDHGISVFFFFFFFFPSESADTKCNVRILTRSNYYSRSRDPKVRRGIDKGLFDAPSSHSHSVLQFYTSHFSAYLRKYHVEASSFFARLFVRFAKTITTDREPCYHRVIIYRASRDVLRCVHQTRLTKGKRSPALLPSLSPRGEWETLSYTWRGPEGPGPEERTPQVAPQWRGGGANGETKPTKVLVDTLAASRNRIFVAFGTNRCSRR